MESDRVHARAAIMRAAVNREDAPGAERGWLDWLRRLRHPGDHRRRHARARPPHPRRGRDARRRLPGARCAEAEARERDRAPSRRWPAATSPARSRPREPPSHGERRRAADRRASTPASSARSCATSSSAARRVELHPCTTPRRGAARARPRRGLPRQRPRRPGRARLRRRHACASSSASGRCSASASATSCSAARSAWRPSSCRSATAAPTTRSRTSRPAGSRSPPRTTASRSSGPGGARDDRRRRAGALGDRLRRRRAHAREPLRPHGRGAARCSTCPAARVQYHPEAGPGPARLALPVRPVPRADRGRLMPRRDDIQQDPDPRLGPDRDRPGRRVRLLRRAGLQGAARGGLRGRARQLEPGDDHDRPGVRRRDLRRAAAARPGRAR